MADLLRRTTATVVVSTIPRAERLRGAVDRALRRRVDSFNWTVVGVARRHGFSVADVRQRPGRADVSWEAAVAAAIDGARRRAPRSRRRWRCPPAQQAERMRAMRRLVGEFNVFRWAGGMLVDAGRVRQQGRLSHRLTMGLRAVEGGGA